MVSAKDGGVWKSGSACWGQFGLVQGEDVNLEVGNKVAEGGTSVVEGVEVYVADAEKGSGFSDDMGSVRRIGVDDIQAKTNNLRDGANVKKSLNDTVYSIPDTLLTLD